MVKMQETDIAAAGSAEPESVAPGKGVHFGFACWAEDGTLPIMPIQVQSGFDLVKKGEFTVKNHLLVEHFRASPARTGKKEISISLLFPV